MHFQTYPSADSQLVWRSRLLGIYFVMSKAVIFFTVNTFFLCILRWEIGQAIADGFSLRGAAWNFVTHGPSVIYAGFVLGVLGCIAVWVRLDPLRRCPLALLLVTLAAMNWLLEGSLGSDRIGQIRERLILCLSVTLSAALTIWPLRSRQVSILQAGWLTLFVAIGCAAARLQANNGDLGGLSSGVMFGILVGFVVAADVFLPGKMIVAPLAGAIAAFLMHAVNPDVHLGLAGWLAPMVTCGITIAVVTRYLDDREIQSE